MWTNSISASRRAANIIAVLILPLTIAAYGKPSKKDPAQLRLDYIAGLERQEATKIPVRTTGSLWIASGPLGDMSSDYKAHNLNDTIIIQVSVQTSAAQSGNVNSQRTYDASSGISGLVGDIATKGLNPLIKANSATALKGQGQTASKTAFQTSLTGVVIAVLPSGNMVVEAHREISINNQKETVIVRGVVRPGDIGPTNIVPSAALSNLEIEMKGKGIISDSTRPPNLITRMVMRIFGF